jgi:hypothetical protein
METLRLRMQAHCAGALQLAQWLEQHHKVGRVYYAGLASHPQHALAMKQAPQQGAVVSFEVRGGREAAWRVLDSVKLISSTANLGDSKTTITHPATTTHARMTQAERDAAGISDSLLRWRWAWKRCRICRLSWSVACRLYSTASKAMHRESGLHVQQEKRSHLASFLRSSLWFRRSFRWTAIIAVHLAMPVLLFGGPLLAGTSSFFAIGHDALEQSYSWMQELARSLHQGYLPLWDPYTQGGHTFVGEIQTGVFYPVNLLFAYFLGSERGISMPALETWIAVHFAFASLGFYWFAREAGSSRAAAFGGALLFAYFGPVAWRAPAQANIFFGLCWMPYAASFAWRFFRSEKTGEAFGCGLVVGLQVTAGHVQPAFHTFILIGSMAAFARWRGGWRAIHGRTWARGLVSFCAGAALLSLPQLLLALQYLSDAYRWIGLVDPIGPWQRIPLDVFLNRFILTPSSLLAIFNPWQIDASGDRNVVYIGLPAAILCACYLLVRPPATSGNDLFRLRTWILTVSGFALALAMGSYGLIAVLIYRLPMMTAVRELGRYAVLFHFVMAFAFALAIDRTLRNGLLEKQVSAWPHWLWGLGIVYAGWLIAYPHGPVIRPVAIQVAMVVAGLVFLKLVPKLTLPLLIISVIACAWLGRDFYFPTLAHGRKSPAAYFSDTPILQGLRTTKERGRVLIEDDADLPKNYGMVAGIETKTGYSATYYRPYFDFMSQDWAVDSRVNDLLNVRWVVSKKQLGLPLVLKDATAGLFLYERPTAFPRAWLASDSAALLRGSAARHKADWSEYSAHRLALRMATEGPDELILSEVAYPGWHVTVDGKEFPVRRVGVGGLKPLFRAVSLSTAGTHEIVFSYQPWRVAL